MYLSFPHRKICEENEIPFGNLVLTIQNLSPEHLKKEIFQNKSISAAVTISESPAISVASMRT